MFYILRIPLLMLPLWLLMAGCKKETLTVPPDKTSVPRTIGEFIENNYDLSLLHAALKKTDLLDSLKQPGAFTMYVPDNSAFNAVGIAAERDIEKMNTDSLRFILRYHIMRDRYFITSFPKQADNKYHTLAGPELYVSVGVEKTGQSNEDYYTFVNGAMIMPDIKRNISLANGVIHVLNRPLNYTQGTVQDYIAGDTSISIFAAAMKKFGYWNDLATRNPLTVFAPSNSAFLSFGITADSVARMNPAAFKPETFGIYPLQMKATRTFSTDGYAINGQNGSDQKSSLKSDSFYVLPSFLYNYYNKRDESQIWIKWMQPNGDPINNPFGPFTVRYYKGYVSGADRLATNGVVHIIDNLFLNPALMLK